MVGLPMDCTIIRIDTNQGISGYGEVRDWGSKTYALMLKSRLLGENPCDVERLFRRIRPVGGHARLGGGVSAVEMALMDLAGKAYGIPAYQLAGGRYRDSVLCYADTPTKRDPDEMIAQLRRRLDQGYEFLKMDIGIDLVADIPGAINAPPGALETEDVMHPFTGIQLTTAGIDALVAYVGRIRDADRVRAAARGRPLRSPQPRVVDPAGSGARPVQPGLVRGHDPWQFADQYARLAAAVTTPICTGEDIYLRDGFTDLVERRAVAVVHPDIMTVGGILETKRVGDYAAEHGIAMALHMAGSPVAAMASVHAAAATESFLALENHSADIPAWSQLIEGLPTPLVQDGRIAVPEAPGPRVHGSDREACTPFLDPRDPGWFEPTDDWDTERAHDRLWS